MSFPNEFDAASLRRLSIGLLSASGVLLIASLGLIGAGVSAKNLDYARQVAVPLWPFAYSGASAIISLIWAEFADHPDTPAEGRGHSKRNYRQSATALLMTSGLIGFVIGAWLLLDRATAF